MSDHRHLRHLIAAFAVPSFVVMGSPARAIDPARLDAKPAATPSATPTPVTVTSASPSTPAQRGKGRGIFGCSASGNKQTAGALVGGFLGGFIGNRIADGSFLGTVVGGALGAAAGSAIGCKLQKEDQAKAEAALETALAKGENQSWQSAETGASGVVEIAASGPSASPAGLRFAPGVEPWGEYQQVGNSFETTMTANVRSRPSLDGRIMGQLPAGTRIWVPALAADTPWYLVSDNGVAQGYVSNALLKQAAAVPSSCKMVTQTITLPDAKSASESYQACQDKTGQWTLTRV